MATNKRFFSPRILNKLDSWLLLNKPATWSARTHLVIYYGAIFMMVLAAICFVFPDDPRSATGAFNWALFTSIITLLAFVVWVIYLLRFNVFKRFGNTSASNSLLTFLLYFVAAGVITLISFVEPVVETIKANIAYGNEEIVKDINAINVKITQLEHDSLDNVWGRDTFYIVNKIPGQASSNDNTVMIDTVVLTPRLNAAGRKIRMMDTADLRVKLGMADSTEKISDSLYVFLSCPDYTWIEESSADNYTNTRVMDDRDIYDSVVIHYHAPAAAVRNELQALIGKYFYNHDEYYYSTHPTITKYLDSIPLKYSTAKVDRSFSNIIERKYRWCGGSGNVLFHMFFYITLVLSLMVFVFRHSTVRTFFFTLLAATVITILTALILAFGRWYQDGSSFFMLLLFYFLVFTVVGATAWANTTRKVVTGIAINLFVMMVYFLPLLITAAHNLWEDEKYRGVPAPHPGPHYWNLVYAEVAGVIILLVLLPTYIYKVYRRWYALPEH